MTSDEERDNSRVFKSEKNHTLEKNSELLFIALYLISHAFMGNILTIFLSHLANDPSITIKPADKGGSIPLMTDDYVKSCLNSLSDPNFYEELPTDPNPKYRTDLDEKKDDLLSSKILNEFEASKLQYGSRPPYFYGLPKIHKKFDRFPPLRPICSGFNSCTSKLSEFVDAFLKPLAPTKSVLHQRHLGFRSKN